jgi:lipopolysaccharide/colanic/teichoic acid biosynthesis glycosyltransferase
MIPHRARGLQLLLLLCQCAIVTGAFWTWFLLRYYRMADWTVVSRHLVYSAFVLLGLILGYWRSGAALAIARPTIAQSSRRSLGQLGGTLFLLLLYLAAAHDAQFSRLFLFTFIPLLYIMLFACNRYLPALLGHFAFRRGQKQKVLLVGPRQKALQVKRWLDQSDHLGSEVIGLLTDDPPEDPPPASRPPRRDSSPPPSYHAKPEVELQPFPSLAPAHSGIAMSWATLPIAALFRYGNKLQTQAAAVTSSSWASLPSNEREQGPAPDAFLGSKRGGSADESLPILGRPGDLEKFPCAPGQMNVVLVELPRINGSMEHYTHVCEERGSRLLVVADLDRIFGHHITMFEDQGLFFLGLRKEPLEDPVNRFLKRCFDIAVSLPVVIFILPPLFLFTWICQRIQSPGPVFFVQPREGFQNQSFPLLKLRTMHVGDPTNLALPSSGQDPRLFPVGRFLRKTSLDEMPQFWNVLRGDMSVVGPRPHLQLYNQQYQRVYFPAYVRSLVKPGVTGLAQARGFRGAADTPEEIVRRMESDIEYLENWSFWLDCWLVLRTAVQIIVPPKGAV